MSGGPFDFTLLSAHERDEYVRLRERPSSTAGRTRMQALEAKAIVPPAVVASAAAVSPWEVEYALRAGVKLSRLSPSERAEWLALADVRGLLEPGQTQRLAELTAKARRPRRSMPAAHNQILARRRRLGARPAASLPPQRKGHRP